MFIANPNIMFPAAVGTAVFMGHVRAALNTGTGNQSFTITWSDAGSHTPACAWFELTHATADGAAVGDSVYAVGAYDGTNEASAAISSGTGLGTANADQYTTDVACIVGMVNGVVDFVATGVSFTANTVTINITNAPSAAWLLKVVAFTGTDAVSVRVANPSTTDAGTVDRTELGQPCNLLIAAAASSTSGNFDETVRANAVLSLGFYSGPTARQRMVSYGERDGVGTMDKRGAWSNNYVAVGALRGWSTADQGWAISNIATGLRITTVELSTIDVDHDFFYLAMAFPSGTEAYVGDFQSPTTASPTDKVITDPNFQGQGIMAVSTHIDAANETEEAATPDADGISSGSAISAASEFSSSITSHDGQVTSDTQSRTDSKICRVTVTDGSESLEADFKQFTGVGFDWTFTVNTNGIAGRVIYMVLKEN